jgi:peroxiredoxin
MLIPNTEFPSITLKKVGEHTPANPEDFSGEAFTLYIAYRGYHYPVCKAQLKQLDQMHQQFAERGVALVPFSADNEEKARRTIADWELNNISIYYGIPIEEARSLGLYISAGVKEGEPELFIEPGMFLVRPDGSLYAVFIQNMPFARPPLNEILGAIDFITKTNYPARGDA